MLAADRYSYLPALLLGLPATARALHWLVAAAARAGRKWHGVAMSAGAGVWVFDSNATSCATISRTDLMISIK